LLRNADGGAIGRLTRFTGEHRDKMEGGDRGKLSWCQTCPCGAQVRSQRITSR